ncbi:MAG: nucleoside hydrolase [Planctomycetes bacterium]|nr:nucleoside hydrolase [Planctomycetota bacterium]MBI3845823.1 nucleoside hydrolase [Planctomycetota bacterium]
MIYVDTDNAMGSPQGDVDDGFAIAALLRAGVPIAAIGSVFGNTDEPLAHENNRRLAALCRFDGPHVRGAASTRDGATHASRFLASRRDRVRVVALGPLTNVARAIESHRGAASRIAEVIVVGGNVSSAGRWPPCWPFEFNLVLDRRASATVFDSVEHLTIVPLDVARRLVVRRSDLALLAGPLGDHVRRESERWFRRCLWIRASSSIRLYDLVAAAYVIDPRLVRVEKKSARVHGNGWIEFGTSGRNVNVVTDVDRARTWSRFVEAVNETEN